MAEPPVVYFDGTCGFCDRSVTFLFDRDTAHALRFAPLQGKIAAARLPEALRADLDTIVFVQDGKTYVRSTAVLRALAAAGGVWMVLGRAALLVPAFVRDAVYRVVARYRYKIFGKYDACRLPRPEERQYFLD